MTKTVFDNRMVAHVWAQRKQPYARSHNGNFHFDGDIIYSYRTPLARFIRTNQGGTAVLLNPRRHSVTTSGKHWPAIRSALPSGRLEFYVPDVGENPFHSDNLKYLADHYPRAVARLLKSRDTREELLTELDDIVSTADQYARAFGLTYEMPDIEADKVKIRAAWDGLIARRKKRQAQPAYINREWHKLVTQAHKENEAWDRSIARRAEYREKLARWIAGENIILPYGWDDAMGVIHMRVYGDEIQTTRGAAFPIEHGRKAFAFILECRKHGREWNRNGHSIHLGHFSIDRIGADGTVTAGCHTVAWEAIARVAKELGLPTD